MSSDLETRVRELESRVSELEDQLYMVVEEIAPKVDEVKSDVSVQLAVMEEQYPDLVDEIRGRVEDE
jgi:uncharacterized coiled-coil protein SlyX